MSSILNALRKLDEQKAVRKPRPVDVTQKVLQGRVPGEGVMLQPWQVIVAITLVAAVSIVVTVLLLGRPQRPPQQVPAREAALPAATMSPVPPPAPATPAAIDESRSRTAVVPDRSARAKAAVPAVVAPVPQPKPVPSAATVPTHSATISEAPALEPAPVQPAATPLRVSGIGWQKDAAARYAVINGTALTEGGSIDGAKVEEILPDKVRVRVNGTVQELTLGK